MWDRKKCSKLVGMLVVGISCVWGSGLQAQPAGQEDLDDAMRIRVTAQSLDDLHRTIQLITVSLDKGLEPENTNLARLMLSDALLERATVLIRAVNTQSLRKNPQVQKIRRIVVSDLRRVLELDDPPADAYYMLGRMMAMPGGDPHEAKRALTQFLEFPEVPKERRAEALILLASMHVSDTKALADFERAIQLAPEKVNYRLARAVYLRSKNRADEAMQDVQAMLEQHPENANLLIFQGELLRQLGQLDEAIASFDQASQEAPMSPIPYQNRGEIYRQQKQFEQAAQQFSKVLQLRPGVLRTLLHRAEAYLAANRPEEALADVEILLEKQPNFVAAHKIRAEVYLNLGQHDKAIADFEEALKLSPEDPALLNNLAWVLATSPKDAYRDGQRAIELATKACKLTRYETPHVLSTLAASYAEAGDFESAIKWSQKAVEIGDPEHDGQLAKELSFYQQQEPWREKQGNTNPLQRTEGE